MKKPTHIEEYIHALSEQSQSLFNELNSLIHQADPNVCVTLFVHQPYFYLPMYETIKFHYRPSIMLTFYKDHVNIFAHANKKYESQLHSYKLTEKYTLQISFNQPLLKDVLIRIFKESLHPQENIE
jgi:hypothetical protein